MDRIRIIRSLGIIGLAAKRPPRTPRLGWFLFNQLVIAVPMSGITKLPIRSVARWLIPYLLQTGRRLRRPRGPIHVLICIADHFEPKDRRTSLKRSLARASRNGCATIPRTSGISATATGGRPVTPSSIRSRNTIPSSSMPWPGSAGRATARSSSNLHHDNDTAENLRKTLLEARDCFRSRHGLLARDRRTGQPAFGFVHGNWALDNSRPDGRWCGVNNELDVLREAGCYADFTFPSVPSPTQPGRSTASTTRSTIPKRPRSHDRGIDVGRARPRPTA